jgi:chemotaxis family two-component system response regulator PixG
MRSSVTRLMKLKHFEFLRNLRNLQFSGQLSRTDSLGRQWLFYFVRGSLVHATGGIHPVKRWQRHLIRYVPHQANSYHTWLHEINPLNSKLDGRLDSQKTSLGWEYDLLVEWVTRNEMTAAQAIDILQANLSDLLFDLAFVGSTTDYIRQDSTLSAPFGQIRLEKITAQVQTRWQAWQNAQLVEYSPNLVPVLRQAEVLQKFGSTQSFQNLTTLLNGQHTLYDLAIQMQRNVVEVTASLAPLIRSRIVELIEGEDLPAPISAATPTALPALPPANQPLIACVDDSFLVRHMMERLLTSAGYQFLGIEDAVRAIGILLARKPDLIFLDLLMPKTNGYEVCQQIRKLSCFQQTPIVILTGSDGYANRLRSNIVGATDFLGKPLDAEAVLTVIQKHLAKPAASNPQSRFNGVHSSIANHY